MHLQLTFDPVALADTRGSIGSLLRFDPPPGAGEPQSPPCASTLSSLEASQLQPAQAMIELDARQVLLRTILSSAVFKKVLNVDPWRTLVDRPWSHRGGNALENDVTGDVAIGEIPAGSETKLHASRSNRYPIESGGFLWSWEQVTERIRRHWDLSAEYSSFVLAFDDKPTALAWNQASWDACWSMYIRYNMSPSGEVRWRLRTARIVFRSSPKSALARTPRSTLIPQHAATARSPSGARKASVNTSRHSHHHHRGTVRVRTV